MMPRRARRRRRNPSGHRWTKVGGFLLGFFGPSALGAIVLAPKRIDDKPSREACEAYADAATRNARLVTAAEAGTALAAWAYKRKAKSESTEALLSGMTWGAAIGAVLSAIGSAAIGAFAEASCNAMGSGGGGLELPGPAPPIAGRRFLGDPLEAREGRRYRARVELTAPVSWLADREKVKAYTRGLGFELVRVWTGEDRIPPDWPAEALGGELDANTYFVEGVATRDISRPRPSQVKMAWEEPTVF